MTTEFNLVNNQPTERQKNRFSKSLGIDKHDYGFNLCEVCNKALGRDGVCPNCGLPSKKAFLNALKQAVIK